MLLYALLHLSGYDLPLEELKRFRHGRARPWHSRIRYYPGVTTTVRWEQIFQWCWDGNCRKMAAARYNTAEHKPDHYIYGIVSDGDLMEGVASEAASLAGHLKLGNIIYFYDDNRISIEGSTELAFTEDRGKRFEAYGWQVLYIDGHDCEAAARAIEVAQQKPKTLVDYSHNIGMGSPIKSIMPRYTAPAGSRLALHQQPGWG